MTHRGAQTATPEKEGINHIALSNTHTFICIYTSAERDRMANTEVPNCRHTFRCFGFSLNHCNMTTEPLASTLKHRDTLQASPTDPRFAYGSSPLSSESSSNAKEKRLTVHQDKEGKVRTLAKIGMFKAS